MLGLVNSRGKVYPFALQNLPFPPRKGQPTMATSPRKMEEERRPAVAIVGANVYRLRVLRMPKLSQEDLHERSGVATETIAVINVFLGWTVIGWVVALAMAARSVPPPSPIPRRPD
jgi:hypothetical protein